MDVDPAGFVAVSWKWRPSPEEMPVMIERVLGIDGVRFAVRQVHCCLNREGQWERGPMPSSRTEEFLARCRFSSFEEAADAIQRFVKSTKGRFV